MEWEHPARSKCQVLVWFVCEEWFSSSVECMKPKYIYNVRERERERDCECAWRARGVCMCVCVCV